MVSSKNMFSFRKSKTELVLMSELKNLLSLLARLFCSIWDKTWWKYWNGVPYLMQISTQSLTHSTGVLEWPANMAGFSSRPRAHITPRTLAWPAILWQSCSENKSPLATTGICLTVSATSINWSKWIGSWRSCFVLAWTVR